MTRRDFLGNTLAALGFAALPGGFLFAAPPGWKRGGKPNLVFGVVADTHLRTAYNGRTIGKMWTPRYFQAALEFFRDAGVDAVMHCGDFAHRGQVAEMQFHADVWNRVFAGRQKPVKLFATGNHDVIGSTYGDFVAKIYPDETERAKHVFANDIAAHWERIWGEKYEGVWHKEVKGYHFFGRHYEMPVGALPEAVLSGAEKFSLKGSRPFFIVQHRIPPKGQRDALRGFPNAMAFFGHWHVSNADWRTVILNKFPAIQCGACRPDGGNGLPDDGVAKAALQGCESLSQSREGLLVRVYDDMLVIERREFGEDGSLGADWVMPFGKYAPHPFSREELKKVIGEPQFRKGAKLEVSLDSNCNKIEKTADNNPLNPVNPVQDDSASPRLTPLATAIAARSARGIRVRIPLADGNPDSRVYAYEVVVIGEAGSKKLFKAVYAAGCNLGIGHEPDGGVTTLEIPKDELPPGKRLTIAARPLTSLGTYGRPISVEVHT